MIKVKTIIAARPSQRKSTSAETPSNLSERDVFHECLRRKGLKRTSQRDLILDVFLTSEKHVTSEELYQRVRERDPSVGFTTVYRTLKLLTECGIAREAQFGDGYTRYEPNLSQGHHDHLICVECGGLTEFYSEQLEHIQDEVIRRHGFQMIDHSLRIWGICKNCRKQARTKAVPS